MHLLFNHRLLREEELKLSLSNRAFQYNDGFFETVMVVNGQLRFWQDHVARISEAAESLQLDLPSYFYQPEFEQALLQLAAKNQATSYGRLKLKVWRAGAGLYTPEITSADWLATVVEASPASAESISIGICQSIKTVYSPLSHFKGPNAPIYTLAGIEKKTTNFDDMLLLSTQGMVSELISSNLFWVMDNKLFTPALDTGCVNGIARRNILRWCRQNNVKVHDAYFTPQRLLDAHAVFAANVTGMRSIKQLQGQSLQQDSSIISQLQVDLF
ncbi:aminotransferase class IV [Pontibacter cellulosilyticus]|uniref:branched-chain-amino-acid transaminase n=1 Tax=Pontibacter cellulosilyticus TaxID=1720253 RepID=A0A923SHH0_9BACT|nr:aminotransferase class IV [Pontibacter cellulosilyticus]MBC5991734.1 aminotransferase class IV [Pontibacter cellulosilyticus]